MFHMIVATLVAVFLVSGCAGPGNQQRAPDWQAQLDEVRHSQNRLELRVEEVTRNLLALRGRLDAQEVALDQLREARAAPEVPPLRVVPLSPPRREVREAPKSRAGSEAAGLYRRAFNAYREKRHGEAILDFEEFLREHPDHEYSDNAQYWIGESYYSQGEFEQAIVEFNRVIDRYPGKEKAPDALLKLGMCFNELKDQERARVFWTRLVDQYPQTEAARRALKYLGTN